MSSASRVCDRYLDYDINMDKSRGGESERSEQLLRKFKWMERLKEKVLAHCWRADIVVLDPSVLEDDALAMLSREAATAAAMLESGDSAAAAANLQWMLPCTNVTVSLGSCVSVLSIS
jgi:hypothetical protein